MGSLVLQSCLFELFLVRVQKKGHKYVLGGFFFIGVLTPYYNHNVRKSWENRGIEVKVTQLRWKEFKDSLGGFFFFKHNKNHTWQETSSVERLIGLFSLLTSFLQETFPRNIKCLPNI